ncbi:SDR family oxidoreductase, partial [Salmonella enterica subsp. enterica serovar Minnesota]|uniref:SDR family oxidoreductase n=1 Tax=Salmonella enterica TaxID=28901 RepID=UPI003D269D1A
AIAAAGAQARYEAVDVTDAIALNAMLARVRSEWGPVIGVVHAAGVLADKRIAEKTDAQFDAVFSTKVEGLR